MNRESFLAGASRFRREQLEIDGFGAVWVREVSAAEARDSAALDKAGKMDSVELAARLAVRVLCQEDGSPLLTEADVAALQTMQMRVLTQINDKAAELSGVGSKKKKAETPTISENDSPTNSAGH